MSKRAYSAWDYPSNTKQNPIPPAKSSQERNRGVGIPQSQQSATTPQSTAPTQRGTVPQRGQNARQNYSMLSDSRPRNNQEIQNYIEKLKEESSRMQEKRTKEQMSDPKIKEGSDMRIEKDSANKEFVENPFRGKDKIKADVRYRAGEFGYMYETDGLGRICRFFAEKLQLTTRDKRLRHDPNTPGKMQYDDAGHLIGDRFGGAATIANLVSQLRSVNRGDYRVMEDHLESVIQNGGTVEMEGRIIYNKTDFRPEGIYIELNIDGKSIELYFSNVQ